MVEARVEVGYILTNRPTDPPPGRALPTNQQTDIRVHWSYTFNDINNRRTHFPVQNETFLPNIICEINQSLRQRLAI